jgi:hypothetical protein
MAMLRALCLKTTEPRDRFSAHATGWRKATSERDSAPAWCSRRSPHGRGAQSFNRT